MSALRRRVQTDFALLRSASTGALPRASRRPFDDAEFCKSSSSSSISLSPLVFGGGSIGDCETTLHCSDAGELRGMFKQWKKDELHEQTPVLAKMQLSMCAVLSRGSTREDVLLHTIIVNPHEAIFMVRSGWAQEIALFCPGGVPIECGPEEVELIAESERVKERGFVYSKGEDKKWREWRYHGLVDQGEEQVLDEIHPLIVTPMQSSGCEHVPMSRSAIEPLQSCSLMDEGADEDGIAAEKCSSSPSIDSISFDERISLFSSGRSSCPPASESYCKSENPREENTPGFRYFECTQLVGQEGVQGEFFETLFNRRIYAKKNYRDMMVRTQNDYNSLVRSPTHTDANLERKILHISREELDFRKQESSKAACFFVCSSFGIDSSMPADAFFSTEEGMDVESAFRKLSAAREEFKVEKWRLGCAGVREGVSGISARAKIHSDLHAYLKNPARHSDILVVEGYTKPNSDFRSDPGTLMFRFVYGPQDHDGSRTTWPGKCCEDAKPGSSAYAYGPVSVSFLNRLPSMSTLRCIVFRRDNKLSITCARFKKERERRGKELYNELVKQNKQGQMSGLLRIGKGDSVTCEPAFEYAFLGSCKLAAPTSPWHVGFFHANSEKALEFAQNREFLFVVNVGLANAVQGLKGWIGKEFARKVSRILIENDQRFSCLRWKRPLIYSKGGRITALQCSESDTTGLLCFCNRGEGKKKWDVQLLELVKDCNSNTVFASWTLNKGGMEMNRVARYIDVLRDILVVPYTKVGPASCHLDDREGRVASWNGNLIRVDEVDGRIVVRDYASCESRLRRVEEVITPGELKGLAGLG